VHDLSFITETVLNKDGTSGSVLASLRTPFVGFALQQVKKDGRCRFVLKDGSGSSNDNAKKQKSEHRVYEGTNSLYH
jgi:hypothetical protein